MTFYGKKRSLKRVSIGLLMVISIVTCGTAGAHFLNQEQEKEQLQHIDTVKTEVDSRNKQIEVQKNELEALTQENYKLRSKLKNLEQQAERIMNVEVTAYDLSVQSCGKSLGHPEYGVTASGISLAGHTLESARAIAVDPNVIPLGSKVKIQFNEVSMQQYNGVYTAVDTGGAIKGNRIDLFFGDFGSNHPSSKTMDFGGQEAIATLVS